MEQKLQEILINGKETIAACGGIDELNSVQVSLTGRNGILTQEMKKLGTLPVEDRKRIGTLANQIRNEIEQLLSAKGKELKDLALSERLKKEAIDVTLPIRPSDQRENQGKLHLLTQVSSELMAYFEGRGFVAVDGPEIDTDFNNFEALNIPAHHPARQEHDTFYLKNHPGFLLRTHTSTMQIRTLCQRRVPIRAISVGSVFRNDSVDATHSPLFHQMEIFVVEPGITIAHLKYCLLDFLGFLFKIDLLKMDENKEPMPVRMRPSFFPFTEPSLEVDICCSRDGHELKLDINGQWLEILGSGMIHRNVFKNCGLESFADGSPICGFAIGVGIERIAMLRYGLSDIRQLYDGDLRWLNHYGQIV